MGRPGPGPHVFWFPGDPKAAPGPPAYESGSEAVNLQNLSMVDLRGRITQGNKIDMAIYIYIYLYIYICILYMYIYIYTHVYVFICVCLFFGTNLINCSPNCFPFAVDILDNARICNAMTN